MSTDSSDISGISSYLEKNFMVIKNLVEDFLYGVEDGDDHSGGFVMLQLEPGATHDSGDSEGHITQYAQTGG
eukprot:UN10711